MYANVQIIPLLTLTSVCTWYEESTPPSYGRSQKTKKAANVISHHHKTKNTHSQQYNNANHSPTIPSSKSDIKKLDKILSKLTKQICNIPENMANILMHLYNEEFGINSTSFILKDINYVENQLIHMLNDQGQLGHIYQRLAKYITNYFFKDTTIYHA
jgi:hypothetical protein